jgi:hypothetical protein
MEPIPTSEEENAILAEVKDHARFWKSDRAKRATVESHLETPPKQEHPGRTPMVNVHQKIDWMIANNKIAFVPGRSGGYLLCPQS